MGRGKTSAMINRINSSSGNERYLFVTPYLTEVDRIKTACASRGFVSPSDEGGKLNNLKHLLACGENVVSTHALFSMLDDEALNLIESVGYSLVMDEVTAVIQKVNISAFDAEDILNDYASPDESGALVWNNKEYTGEFDELRELIEKKSVYAYSKSKWMIIMDKKLFTSFQDVYLMTYMFEDQVQRCYFDLVDIPYQRLYVSGNSVDTYGLVEDKTEDIKYDYSNLIHIVNSDKLNKIGDGRTALSKGWYTRHQTKMSLKRLKDNVYNFFRNYTKTPASKNLWTTFGKDERYNVDWQKMIAGNGYASGFLSCNARGTNKYKNCVAAAYLVNRFPDTSVKNFLEQHNIYIDQDKFALSEMLQWIWRTAIRDGKEITLYIPSKRMRELLEQWIEDNK